MWREVSNFTSLRYFFPSNAVVKFDYFQFYFSHAQCVLSYHQIKVPWGLPSEIREAAKNGLFLVTTKKKDREALKK